MPGFSAGSAYVDLVPRLQQGWSGAVEKEVDGPLGRIRGKSAAIGKAIGLGLGAGVIGGGALLLKMGSDLDGALDNLQTKTGFTGAELSKLEDSFRNVGKRVPNDLAEVSDAVALVAQKTGLSGQPLEELSTQLLTLSRITGTDLATNVEATARVFGDWGIATEDQSAKLDFLFRASQKTGVPVADLQEKLTKFGGPLRQLGFGFEESAALIGKFQKEGVNTDLVMGSLRISLGKMAKAGEDPKATLARVTDEIKNAGSAGEANALALELFGARAGPDMAAAIREGRFEVGDLVADLKNGKGTIEGSAAATDDFGEKFSKLKNRIILGLEKPAGQAFDAVNVLFDKMVPFGEWLADRLPGAFDAVEQAVRPFLDSAKQLFDVIFRGDFTGGPFAEDSPWIDGAFRIREFFVEQLLPAAKEFFGWLERNAKPILAVVGGAFLLLAAPFLTVGAALFAAYVKFEGFRKVVDTVARWLVANVPPALEKMRAGIAVAFEWLKTNVPPIVAAIVAGIMVAWAWVRDNVLPIVKTIVSTIVEAVRSVVAWVEENWPRIQAAIASVMAQVRSTIETAVSIIMWIWNTFGDEILSVLTTAWDFVRRTVENAINFVRSIIEGVLSLIAGDWSGAWDGIMGALSAIWDQIVNLIGSAGELALDALEAVLSLFREAWDAAWELMTDTLGAIWDGLTDAAKGALNGLLGALEAGINAAIGLLNTALDGIDKAAGPLVNFGEIPEVDLPELRAGGGPVRPGKDYIVGELGPELLRMRGTGGHVFPNHALDSITGSSSGSGVVLQDGAVRVDARGIDEPETVGDYAARSIGWRLNVGGKR
jgi:phage-related minor tail protein